MTVELYNGFYSIRNPATPVSVFVLELQDGHYLVSQTLLEQFRFQDLVRECGSSPNLKRWLHEHPAMALVIIYTNCSHFDEDKYVKEYMYKYGVDHVRGGSYTTESLDIGHRAFILSEIQFANTKMKRDPIRPNANRMVVARKQDTTMKRPDLKGVGGGDDPVENRYMDTKQTNEVRHPKQEPQVNSHSASVTTWVYDLYADTCEVVNRTWAELWPPSFWTSTVPSSHSTVKN